jgi:hypothetical protein
VASVLTDLNATGVKPMAAYRQAVTDLLCSPAFKTAIERQGLQLVNYDDLKAEGLDRAKRPWIADPYGQARKRPIEQPDED